jgi:hypothetical protein
MLRRTAVTMIAVAVVAMFVAIPSAHAATPKAACYNAWIATKGMMYQVNLEFDVESDEWLGAYYANQSAYFAFLEAYDVEKGVRGASLYDVRDHLDDALLELFYLSQMDLPDDIQEAVQSATWYATIARKTVNHNLQ